MLTIESKKLSCGIIFVNEKSEVLMIHSTGQDHWDIPKGTKNRDEREIEAAIREAEEETGISVSEENLKDLNWFEYNKYKDLWLFITKMPEIEINKLCCSSYFLDDSGIRMPEADCFEMVPLSEMEQRACYSMQKILESGGLKKDIQNYVESNF